MLLLQHHSLNKILGLPPPLEVKDTHGKGIGRATVKKVNNIQTFLKWLKFSKIGVTLNTNEIGRAHV